MLEFETAARHAPAAQVLDEMTATGCAGTEHRALSLALTTDRRSSGSSPIHLSTLHIPAHPATDRVCPITTPFPSRR